MNKTVLKLGFFVVLLLTGFIVYNSLIKTGFYKVISEKLSPPDKKIVELFEKGADLDNPLIVPDGMSVGLYADLESAKPRVLALDSNEVLFVSLTNQGKIVALPDENSDGISDKTITVASNLKQPHGIAFDESFIYIAETDNVSRYEYDSKNFTIGVKQKLFDLPGGGRHFSRTIKIHNDKLYTTVGSSCDTCVESDEKRSAMLVSDLDGKNLRVFARGLRNTVFFDFDKDENIWGNDMGRDFLGDNLPPDELNIIKSPSTGSGTANYGWPYCYGAKIRDTKFENGQKLDYCVNTISSKYDYPAHIAPLGITFIDSPLFSENDHGDILSAWHGSWNSSVPVGYKIVKLNLENGNIVGMEDFMTGFIKDGEVVGRPVDILFDKNGYLYVSDDHAGLIYIVSKDKT